MLRCATRLCLAALTLLGAAPALAQDWGEDDDGWADDGGAPQVAVPALPTLAPASASPHRFTFGGFLRRDEAWWVDRGEVAKVRHSLDLEAEYRYAQALKLRGSVHGAHDLAYAVVGPSKFDPEQVDRYEARIIPGELYASYGLGPAEITVGRQIVAWGEGDVLSPLDVVNPRDNREPGLADLDDLRLAVLATRIGWFVGDHRFELMGIHESYFGEFAPPLADYSPFAAVVGGQPGVAALLRGKRVRFVHAQDRFEAASQAALARWVYKGPGLDLGLYAASVLDRQGVVQLPDISPALLTAERVDLVLDHRRYTLVGTSGATSAGSWLFKWEVAGELERAFNTGDPGAAVPRLEVDRASTITGMGSVGYSGFADTQLFVELQKGWLLGGPDDVLLPVEAPVAAVRAQQTWLRDRLTLAVAATAIGWRAERGWLVRGEATYTVFDGLKVAAGYIHYAPGDAGEFGPFTGFDRHDRVFWKLRTDFGHTWQ